MLGTHTTNTKSGERGLVSFITFCKVRHRAKGRWY